MNRAIIELSFKESDVIKEINGQIEEPETKQAGN